MWRACLTPEERQAILESKEPAEIDIVPVASAGTYHLDCAALTPDDIGLTGGKAANFGFLRRAIPDNAPDPALALTFDLWNDFMAQSYGGGTLAESIAQDLAGFTFPPEISSLRPVLETIRTRIRKQADFSASQKSAIIGALDDFADDRKIRFRSSTNIEDSAAYSGAGLYDSYSGCIADDTDGDDSGPSHCDPDEAKERGVFRAIRKVYASFYNENAFIERLRLGIDESRVGMAVLVHYSFPDEIEMANGVATLDIRKPADGPRMVAAQLVSQSGADSITNPDSGFRPEVVSATYDGAPAGAALNVEQHSALVGAGDTVLEWTGEYTELLGLLDTAARAYEAWFAAEQILELDFEWKLVVPGTLVIKQIRRIPHVPPVPPPRHRIDPMKRPIRHLVAALILATPIAAAGEDPRITGFSVSGGRANLQWEGGAPPFEVESGSDLSGWTRVAQTVESPVSVPAGDGPATFFRIACEQAVAGTHLGQLRIDEGEFGKPLARHRLKSLWDFHLPETGTPSNIPEEFFQQLTLRLIYREGRGLSTFTGTLGDLPGASIATAARKITASWTFGHGGGYKLLMVETLVDTASLYEISDDPVAAWLHRDLSFEVGAATYATKYILGIPANHGTQPTTGATTLPPSRSTPTWLIPLTRIRSGPRFCARPQGLKTSRSRAAVSP